MDCYHWLVPVDTTRLFTKYDLVVSTSSSRTRLVAKALGDLQVGEMTFAAANPPFHDKAVLLERAVRVGILVPATWTKATAIPDGVGPIFFKPALESINGEWRAVRDYRHLPAEESCVAELSRRLIAEIGYTGWGLTEFKRCPKNVDSMLMRVNAKMWALVKFAFRRMPELARLLLNFASAKPVPADMIWPSQLFLAGPGSWLAGAPYLLRNPLIAEPVSWRSVTMAFLPQPSRRWLRRRSGPIAWRQWTMGNLPTVKELERCPSGSSPAKARSAI
jgi:hypothetical protein